MWLYLIIFLIPVLFYYTGISTKQGQSTFLACFLCALALFVGMSDMLGGYDRYIYGEHFDDISDKLTQGVSWFDPRIWDIYEKGYLIMNILFAYITHNRYIFIFGLTLLIYFNFYVGLKRHIKNYPFALIIFLGLFFFFTFTYLRQVAAVSIALLSIKYLIERKKLKFFLMILLVATFHKSGIFFSIIYFIPMKKFSRSTVVQILVLCLVLGISGISSFIFDTYVETAKVEFQFDYAEDSGIRFTYLLEAIVFIAIILYNYEKISAERNDVVFLNMALLFCATLLIFIRSSNGGRLSWYFMFGVIYIFSTIVSHRSFLKPRSEQLLALMIIGILFFQYMRVYINWQNYQNLYPYKTFLTNGHREGDYSWENFEYDHRYDNNKFYREPFSLIK